MLMVYSSSLTDAEWEILEPLLLKSLPQKKKTKPVSWSYRALIDSMIYRLKNDINWEDLLKDLPPCLGAHSLAPQSDAGSHRYSTVFWHYNQWRKAGSFETLMTLLHGQVREQAQKSPMDHIDDGRFSSSQEHVQCECGIKRVLFLQSHKRNKAASSSRYARISFFLHFVRQRTFQMIWVC